MKKFRLLVLVTLMLASCVGTALAASYQGVIFYDGPTDLEGFNKMAAEGLQQAVDESQDRFDIAAYYNHGNDKIPFAKIGEVVSRKTDFVIGIGTYFSEPFLALAEKYPRTKFLLVDAELKKNTKLSPNLACAIFAEEEAGYMVGIVAAKQSKTGTIGFIGGMKNYPTIKRFLRGYKAGAKSVNKRIDIETAYLNSFVDEEKMTAKAQEMYEDCDVIFHAAGNTGNALFKVAAAEKKYAIGCDYDEGAVQQERERRYVLTSALKRVNRPVYNFMQAISEDCFQGGIVKYSMQDDTVGYAVNEWNKELLAPAQGALDDAEARIYFGDLKIK